MFGALRAQLPPLILALWLTSLSAAAQEDFNQRAAAQFDAGVQAYKQADYARAAEAFLAADSLLPSATALSNALQASRRAGLPLLIARAAERALARPDTSEADRRGAQNDLLEHGPKLSRMEISCASACQAEVDGTPLALHGSYVLPGEHRVAANGFAERVVHCQLGLPCRVELVPLASAPSANETARESERPTASATPASEPPASAAPAHERRKKNRLPLGVFAGSGAGALILLSLATWQGVAALDAKEAYKTDGGGWSDVTRHAHASDYLLAGGIVLAGTAIASAIWWVDWGAYGETKLTLSGQGGATLTVRRRF